MSDQPKEIEIETKTEKRPLSNQRVGPKKLFNANGAGFRSPRGKHLRLRSKQQWDNTAESNT